MDIKSLDALRQVDERTLRFAPLRLALGGMMQPEDAAVFSKRRSATRNWGRSGRYRTRSRWVPAAFSSLGTDGYGSPSPSAAPLGCIRTPGPDISCTCPVTTSGILSQSPYELTQHGAQIDRVRRV